MKLFKSEFGHYKVIYKTEDAFEVPDDTPLERPGIVTLYNVRGFDPVLVPAEIAKQNQLVTRVVWRPHERATAPSA